MKQLSEKMKYVVILICILHVCVADNATNETIEVTAPVGKIRGLVMNSRLGRKIYSFRAIRYAEPPIGELRFEVPVPKADWNDVYDATQEGPSCPYPQNTFRSEDCLLLNVYTTKLPSAGVKGGHRVKRPVMVFFPPGGFYSFSAQSYVFGPQYLMDKDLVLVTANYRLATLGFLSTGDSWAPGNLGLKDQVVVLKWIQRNIEAFGGDPNSVTLSGYSAGSFSSILHMVSPMSRGLFHRVIASSSSPVKKYPLPKDQKEIAIKQAQLLGCPTDSSENIVKCLKTKPVENFVDTIPQFFEWYGNPILQWSPVVEPDIPGVERFVLDQPANLIMQGKIQNVPIIIGVTRDEFGGLAARAVDSINAGNFTAVRELNDDWYRIAPISFMYERNTSRSRQISDELRRFYLNGQPVGLNNIPGYADLWCDTITTFPVYRTAKLIATHSHAPVYFYKFTYEGRYSFFPYQNSTPFGVSHHDDLQYLYYMSFVFPFTQPNDPEAPMLERMTSMWSNFVQTGEPIPRNEDIFRNVTWERYVPERDNYLDINLNPTMKHGFFPERMQEMERLFPISMLTEEDAVKH